MKIQLYRELFIDELSKYFDNSLFSNYAKHLLFKYFEELETEINDDFNINFPDICVQWEENKLETILDSYNLNSIEELKEKTIVIKTYFLDSEEYVLYKMF